MRGVQNLAAKRAGTGQDLDRSGYSPVGVLDNQADGALTALARGVTPGPRLERVGCGRPNEEVLPGTLIGLGRRAHREVAAVATGWMPRWPGHGRPGRGKASDMSRTIVVSSGIRKARLTAR